MLSADDIRTVFGQTGIQNGDTLIVQSSYKGLGGVVGGPEGFIRALIDVLGPSGTLIMPAYNFTSWTEGHYFDIKETPSKVGVVPEIFRLMSGVRRTRHPIHSLSVYGRLREELCSIDSVDSFGKDSVFARLHECNALYTTLGTGLGMPFLPCHYPETLMKVPYRRQKLFSGIYVGESGQPELKTYGFHVRSHTRKTTAVYDAHVLQFERGYVKEVRHGEMKLLYSRADTYYSSMVDIIKERPELFQ